jgi:hypothetical protein
MFLRDVRVLLAVAALAAAIGMSSSLAGQTGASSSSSETEWRFFGGDAGATRYSPANQITADNVRDLRVALRRRGAPVNWSAFLVIYPAIGYRPVCDTSNINLNASRTAFDAYPEADAAV